MCTQADHNVEPVAANTQPTTAVVAAKPQKRVYSWEYGSPNKLNLIKSNDASSELDLSAGLNDNQVAYYFDVNNVPTYKRAVYHGTESVTPNDIIFKQDFMKTPNMATVSPYSVVVYDKNDLTKAIRLTDFTNEKDAKHVLDKLVKPNEVTYMYAGGVPVKKRFRGENSVQIVGTDPIWEALKIKPEPKAQIEIRVYSQNDLNKILSSKIVESFDELEWRKTPMSNDQIGYAFVDGKPVKSRKGNMETKDVLSLDPIWETLKPKAGQMVAKVFKKNNLVNPLRTININKPEDTHSVTGTSIYGDEVIYVFTDGVATHIRAFGRDVKAIPTNDPIFANGIPVQTKESVVSITPAVDTEKPVTLQEFLKELMKAHEDKKRTYFDYDMFKTLLQKFWPEKDEYYENDKSISTATYRMFDILNNWNPPAKKKNKKYNFGVHKLRHDFIIEAARLVNTSNPSDKLVESIESFGKATSMFIGDWQSDIRVVLAKHFNNPLWLKNGVFTANNESYELEQIDMVIT